MGQPLKKSEVLTWITDGQKTYKEHNGQTSTDAASEKKKEAVKNLVDNLFSKLAIGILNPIDRDS